MKKQAVAMAFSSALLSLASSAGAQALPQPPVSAPETPTSANTPTAADSGFESSGIPSSGSYLPKSLTVADGIGLTPTVAVSYGHTDNVALAPKALAKSSAVVSLTPKLLSSAAYKADRYSLGYQGDFIRYTSSTNDNLSNHEIAGTAANELDSSLAVNTRLAYLDKMDPAGSTDRAASTELDHWHAASGTVLVRYGAQGAQGRVEVELGGFDKKYVNNRSVTQDADYLSTNLATRFGWRVMPKTTALVEYRNTRFDYKRNVQGLDNTEQRYLVGAEWDATALTTGTFKVGYLQKKFEAGTRKDFKGLTWEGGLSWKPLTYSTLDLSTGRSAADPSGTLGDYIKNTFISTNWTHQWSSSLGTRVSLAHNESDFVGTARLDKVNSLGVTVNYDFRRWARVGASYGYAKRNSSPQFEYARNQLSVFGEFAF